MVNQYKSILILFFFYFEVILSLMSA